MKIEDFEIIANMLRAGGKFDHYHNRYEVIKEGQFHNNNGPAIFHLNNGGKLEWYCNGLLHRLDGPAYISVGGEVWYKDGQVHRDNGPAIILSQGHREWRIDGKLHNLNGPAMIESNGTERWYIDGKPAKPPASDPAGDDDI